ncbi:hypothetical protein ACQRBF_08085 [Peptoniphilaceae bacterium SGI.131]
MLVINGGLWAIKKAIKYLDSMIIFILCVAFSIFILQKINPELLENYEALIITLLASGTIAFFYNKLIKTIFEKYFFYKKGEDSKANKAVFAVYNFIVSFMAASITVFFMHENNFIIRKNTTVLFWIFLAVLTFVYYKFRVLQFGYDIVKDYIEDIEEEIE